MEEALQALERLFLACTQNKTLAKLRRSLSQEPAVLHEENVTRCLTHLEAIRTLEPFDAIRHIQSNDIERPLADILLAWYYEIRTEIPPEQLEGIG